MKLPRRTFLRLAAGAAALPAVSRIARAQSYPSRTVRIVVGFPAGQAIDISARLMAEWLQQRLGQSFIVENRPGAAANVATEMVARSPADGYTLLIISSNNVINTTLYGTVDFAREIAPIATFGRGYQVLNVNNWLTGRRPSPSLSPSPKPILASSTWRRLELEVPGMWPERCSR